MLKGKRGDPWLLYTREGSMTQKRSRIYEFEYQIVFFIIIIVAIVFFLILLSLFLNACFFLNYVYLETVRAQSKITRHNRFWNETDTTNRCCKTRVSRAGLKSCAFSLRVPLVLPGRRNRLPCGGGDVNRPGRDDTGGGGAGRGRRACVVPVRRRTSANPYRQ